MKGVVKVFNLLDEYKISQHIRPVELSNGTFINKYKINSDLIAEEFFEETENGLFLHQIQESSGRSGRVVATCNIYYNPKDHKWLAYSLDKEEKTDWHYTDEEMADAFVTLLSGKPQAYAAV
jgi:hypothetical protein